MNSIANAAFKITVNVERYEKHQSTYPLTSDTRLALSAQQLTTREKNKRQNEINHKSNIVILVNIIFVFYLTNNHGSQANIRNWAAANGRKKVNDLRFFFFQEHLDIIDN